MPDGTTLFVERLPAWVAAAPEVRLPALETLAARGRALPAPAASPDQARFTLLGGDRSASVPAGALTAAAQAGCAVDGYWLRADPVTLRASLTQVYLAGAGMADLSPPERSQIREAVRAELARHDLTLVEAGGGGCWAVRLPEPLRFAFTPLDVALGADVAEHLPVAPAARDWRRLMNDLQIVLHNHPVNVDRRGRGRVVVNGVWFWGGGLSPEPPDTLPYKRIASRHPVSAGLAHCFGMALDAPPDAPGTAVGNGFVDWPVDEADPVRALRRLDRCVETLLSRTVQAPLRVYAGGRSGWLAPRSRWSRAWRRRQPLAAQLSGPVPANEAPATGVDA